jgi:hypothetical protein
MPQRSAHTLNWLLNLRWIALSAVCLGVDYRLGPFIQFPIVYLIPVSLAAWHSSRTLALTLAIVLPLGRLYFITLWDPPWTLVEAGVNAVIRMSVLASFAWLVARTADQNQRLSSDVSILSGLLPVCRRCRRIHHRGGEWQPLDVYMRENPGAFTQEFCPECLTAADEVFKRR